MNSNDRQSPSNIFNMQEKALVLCFLLTIILVDTSYCQPDSTLRILAPFPQHVVKMTGQGFSSFGDGIRRIYVGERPSATTHRIADSLRILFIDKFGIESEVVRLSQAEIGIGNIFLYIEGEMQTWDFYHEFLGYHIGDLALPNGGYLHWAMHDRAVLKGKDAIGLLHGWQTLRSILQEGPEGGVMEEPVVVIDFPDYSERFGPNIVHSFPNPDLPLDRISFDAEVFVDDFPEDRATHITIVKLMYKTARDSSHWVGGIDFESLGDDQYRASLNANGARGMNYFIEATDDRGIVRRSPPNANDSSCFRIGDPLNLEVEEEAVLPGNYVIKSISPNPFNSRTSIEFHLPRRCVVLALVTDLTGKEVFRLINDYEAGQNRVSIEATEWTSGIYLLQISSEDATFGAQLNCIK